MSKITIYDIAKEANCSTATVSLALSGNKRIHINTRQRILEIADQLGYTPNYIAQSLSKRATNTLGLIVPNIDNPLFAQMVSGVETYANEKGYHLILGLSNACVEKELYYLDMLQREQVDGLIVLPTFLEALEKKLHTSDKCASSIVLCGSSGTDLHTNLSYAKCDNRLGAFLAVSHLLSIGKKRIGCIFPVSHKDQYFSRECGYKDALLSYGIDYDDKLLKLCAPDNHSIFQATLELLKEQKPDAIFCLYDYCAISVMRAIHSMNLHIPADISVIGYDNIPISEYLPTSLSTIDTRSKEVGEKAAELLINQITTADTSVEQIVLKPELVIRESTAH